MSSATWPPRSVSNIRLILHCFQTLTKPIPKHKNTSFMYTYFKIIICLKWSTMLKIASTPNLLQYWLQYHLMIQPCTKRTVFEVWPWRDQPWHWMSQDNLPRGCRYTERWAAKGTDKFNWYASINAFIIHSVAIIMLFIHSSRLNCGWLWSTPPYTKNCKVYWIPLLSTFPLI